MKAKGTFVSIGRIGLWALREWPGVQAGPVGDIAVELLRSSGAPISERKLFEQIIAIRQLLPTSIRRALKADCRLTRLPGPNWALAKNSSCLENLANDMDSQRTR